jgi:hypothetical protein
MFRPVPVFKCMVPPPLWNMSPVPLFVYWSPLPLCRMAVCWVKS